MAVNDGAVDVEKAASAVAPEFSVLTVRLTSHVGVVLVVGGLFPLRTTSAIDPFSTNGPSGESENGSNVVLGGIHVPFGIGVSGTPSHQVPESVVQKLVAQALIKPVVLSTAGCPGLPESPSSMPLVPLIS